MTSRECERARANALKLRRDGLSIAEIAGQLGCPRGTVAGWVRGVGESCLIRACELCGERFVTATARQRFCTPAHAAKHRRIYGPPSLITVYQQQARELEGELARLRDMLAAGAGSGSGPRL